ncbi:MAG: ImmA/IrrE family metallo-endopeptidase [Chloroflexi bacterium]|nr:ImmA/IrrE family metallo-endopeptidase [Chloroflexota bacterium]
MSACTTTLRLLISSTSSSTCSSSANAHSGRRFPFTAEIYGLWVPAPTTDYIFVNAHLLPAHRVHTMLHEIAHLLLNHRGVDIRSVLGEPVWQALGLSSGTGHLRSVALNDSPEDEEAEVFVLLIQQRVARARAVAGTVWGIDVSSGDASVRPRSRLEQLAGSAWTTKRSSSVSIFCSGSIWRTDFLWHWLNAKSRMARHSMSGG